MATAASGKAHVGMNADLHGQFAQGLARLQVGDGGSGAREQRLGEHAPLWRGVRRERDDLAAGEHRVGRVQAVRQPRLVKADARGAQRFARASSR